MIGVGTALAIVLGMNRQPSRRAGREQARSEDGSTHPGLDNGDSAPTLCPSMPNRATSFVPVDATVVAVPPCGTGIELLLILPF
jgi:hypothetical protein